MEPFYMTFPMQNLFLAELEYERDFERMKEMYPRKTAKIASMVSDWCDELEFEGSRIYDENPDKTMMAREVQRLYESIKKSLLSGAPGGEAAVNEEIAADDPAAEDYAAEEESGSFLLLPPAEWALEGESAGDGKNVCQEEPNLLSGQADLSGPGTPPGPGMMPPPPDMTPPPCSDWLCSVVGILFSNEIYRRRCRYRRMRRWW